MHFDQHLTTHTQTITLLSEALEREVRVDLYFPPGPWQPSRASLLLINDGQDLVTMGFDRILQDLYHNQAISPLLCVGIHCGEDRKNEYGMLSSPDFKGRGAKAALYERFVFEELLPQLYVSFQVRDCQSRAFAGFSLGGLSALDLVWNHADFFSVAGVFSGSLWWRSRSKDEKDFNEWTDRLMHRQIRQQSYRPGLKFFFQCGEGDEAEDRNKNGVIDSIDDTIDVMRELLAKGYLEGRDFQYLQLKDGRHDVPTWARAFPAFLKWGWGHTVHHNF